MPDKHGLTESFTDSLNIGRKGFNKVSLEQFKIEDSTYVVIRFFSKHADKWIIKNEFHLPKDGITSSDPSVSDFNNDVLNDFTFISAIAARGGNEIRTLFIYDKKNDELILIKNSDTFPNLSYNQELNCIEAFALSGCNSTIFATIEADSLRTFARADQCDSIKVFAYDKKGEEKLILKRSINADDAMDFTDYNLLKNYRK
ncbi:XAC2610-related protein [Mucilaginibacter oryzae]|nr:hypothetical protein [Mucilaginibacter oryzae]